MGVPKPPVDIEWYDDGLTLQEQLDLKKKLTLKVTERYHDKTKDRIISELRQKLAADEEYIKEIEDSIEQSQIVIDLRKELKEAVEKREEIVKQYAIINQKYSQLLNNPEFHFQEYKDTIKDLKLEIESLKKTRDSLIYQLHACAQQKNQK